MITTVNVRSITIESDSGWYRAYLSDDEDGITVYLWSQFAHNSAARVFKPLYQTTLDVPLHVAIDRVAEMLNDLSPDVLAVARRLHQETA